MMIVGNTCNYPVACVSLDFTIGGHHPIPITRRDYLSLNKHSFMAKETLFKDKQVDADPSRIFEMRLHEIMGSVIAFAYGTHEDGSPNIIGTGFDVANIDEPKIGLFATCLHVMTEIAVIRDLDSTGLKEKGLIDKKRRIALRDNDKYVHASSVKRSFIAQSL
jgi:hypothetical protein